jgi:lipocalin
MKIAFIASLAAAAITPLCIDARAKCEAVEVGKVVGNWVEVGRSFIIRNTFQRGCECVEAKYTLKPDNKNIEVVNICVRDGVPINIVGNALPLTNSELRVSFPQEGPLGSIANFFQELNQGPNFIIKNVWADAEGNYQRALIVAPQNRIPFNRFLESIWILARTPTISEEQIKETLDYARASGYNPDASRWEKTEQTTCRK